ncbi:hypothetical protein FACS1894133_2390 [Clostridia bacterium]|nr:hypothetical protein FACS1894133_2390 [Clostridia bacterium]
MCSYLDYKQKLTVIFYTEEKIMKTKVFSKKFARKAVTFAAMAAVLISVMIITAYAEGGGGGGNFAGTNPEHVDVTSMETLITIVFWAVRIIIGGVGAIPAIIKIVQGQADENPRDRNAGIAGMVVTGACVAATFAIEKLFTSS